MMNAKPESPSTRSPGAQDQEAHAPSNFLREQIAEDVRTKKFGDAVIQTRFPPEPNGYLHIGHAKAICISFGLADEFGGKTNLRFDDTNPEKEEQEYVDSIQKDIHWLGFDWERLCFASDYFPQLYEWAVQLIYPPMRFASIAEPSRSPAKTRHIATAPLKKISISFSA